MFCTKWTFFFISTYEQKVLQIMLSNVFPLKLVKLFYVHAFHCFTSCGQVITICGCENCLLDSSESWDSRAWLR